LVPKGGGNWVVERGFEAWKLFGKGNLLGICPRTH